MTIHESLQAKLEANRARRIAQEAAAAIEQSVETAIARADRCLTNRAKVNAWIECAADTLRNGGRRSFPLTGAQVYVLARTLAHVAKRRVPQCEECGSGAIAGEIPNARIASSWS